MYLQSYGRKNGVPSGHGHVSWYSDWIWRVEVVY